jgi:hypothetical protein
MGILLIGFSDGRVQIRDSLNLKKVYATVESANDSPVEKITFNVENYAILIILHQNGELSRAIFNKNED